MGKGIFPDLKMTSHTNYCMMGIESDQSGQNLVIVSSLDNLIKGAAGQAIQNMNIMFIKNNHLYSQDILQLQ